MQKAIVKVTTSRPVATSQDWAAFDFVVKTLNGRLSKKSQRVYGQTLSKWAAYCESKNIHPLDLRQENVLNFLANDDVVYRTRQREFSTLRHIAEIYATMNYSNPAAKAMYDLLKMAKAPKDNAPDRERRRRALAVEDVNKAMAAWDEKKFSKKQALLVARDRALIALLFATGLRRDEVVELRRSDINLEDCTLKIWHGKGDKQRDVTIVNGFWIEPLKTWLSLLGPDRKYIFPPLFKNKLGKDEAMHNQAVYRAVKHTERLSGVSMSPHDLRRTHIHSLIAAGADLRNVQDQAGHAQPQTTLLYSYPASAKKRRETFRLGFGIK
jgi:integrase